MLYEASFPKSVNQMCRHYLACLLYHTHLSSLNTITYIITLAWQTSVCNIWNNVHHKNTSQKQERTKHFLNIRFAISVSSICRVSTTVWLLRLCTSVSQKTIILVLRNCVLNVRSMKLFSDFVVTYRC